MTKVGRRRKLRKHLGSITIAGVVVVMLCFVSVSTVGLRLQNMNKQERIEDLQAQIEEEKKRAEEIKEYEKYVQTKKFAEEVAKEKLGLVYEDEIIFKAED